MPDKAKGSNSPTGEMSPEEIAAFEQRASELGSKIDRVQAERQAEISAEEDKAIRGRGMAYGLRMSSELVAAILVGGFIGYVLDQLLGTTPWLFLLFFVLGFAAGIKSVLRTFNRMQEEIKRETGGNIGHAVPDNDDD